MKKICYLLVLAPCLLIPILLQSSAQNYETSRKLAEELYVQGSYAKANELYRQLDLSGLQTNEQRWVRFRLADTLWRSQAGTRTHDSSNFDTALKELTGLVATSSRKEEEDRIWAEAQESLGDFHWTRPQMRNWSQAWEHYRKALDWWAGAHDVELARQRYLGIIWKADSAPEEYYYYGYHGNYIPQDILEDTLRIVQTQEDKAHAHYLMAMTLIYQVGDVSQHNRVVTEFQAALEAGPKTEWYDDALYHYASWHLRSGEIIPLENGGWTHEPNFEKALELFRKLVNSFSKGETRYYDDAQNQIKNITSPSLSVGVHNIFIPDSEIQFALNWRNLDKVNFTLHSINLAENLDMRSGNASGHVWIQKINVDGAKQVKSWSRDLKVKRKHQPGQENIQLDEKLPMGAYVLEAKSGEVSARELILVTDASLVLKTAGNKALVYFCNGQNGSPIRNASVKLWQRIYENSKDVWILKPGKQSEDGLFYYELNESSGGHELFGVASSGNQQAFSSGYHHHYSSADNHPNSWKIYAFTDRPAYRPEETVQWKCMVRRYDGSSYSIPSGATIQYEIVDPRGTKVKEGKLSLNSFGSAWDNLELASSMPLGEYRISFYNQNKSDHIGGAQLFRLEEYKLPEFKVAIQTPEVDGKKKIFRLGDSVEVTVQADYYFGGPVANASVEVVVHQNSLYHIWYPERDFPWFYDPGDRHSYRYPHAHNGQIIKREILKTDASGKVTFNFQTPAHQYNDLEYRVEARVTDSSRREIIGTDTIKVTRQSYYVYPNPEHRIYHPQDKVTVNFKALDANDQPVQAEGRVKVTRDYWFEIWVSPEGKEVKGEELKALRQKIGIFPPPPSHPDQNGWKLKFSGYMHDEILTRTLKTDKNGEAALSFTPEQEGYYRVEWKSPDRSPAEITGSTTVWVANHATTELGYRHGGLEIIIDKDTFRSGETSAVMLNVPANDRYVLFSVEGDDLYSYQLIHLTGTVKLLTLPITEKHVPNIFLNAFMVSDWNLYTDHKEVVVPPLKHYLTVEVQSDRQQYQPQENGTLKIVTRDYEGKPVAAEVALSLVDESVFYIQKDYAEDPRKFFYGNKRHMQGQVQSTFQQKSYKRLKDSKDAQEEDEYLQYRDGRNERRKLERMAGMKEKNGNYGLAAQAAAMPSSRADMTYAAEATLGDVSADRFQLKVAKSSPVDGTEESPNVEVRSDFRSTIFWGPDLKTDENGEARVQIKYPDSLTTWKATARVGTTANQFGFAETNTVTRKPLIVRLQAPRFFVAGDTVTISAVINNNTDENMTVEPRIEVGGPLQISEMKRSAVKVEGNGEARIDWIAKVAEPGQVKIKVFGLGKVHSDAMEKTYVSYEHGIEKFISRSGKVRGSEVSIHLDIPRERKPGSTSLEVQIAPSMAVTMLDALPYLIEFPYGCTEQTMSRFLPAVITARTLKDLNINPEEAMARVFGGIEQQHTGKTHPKGRKNLAELDAMMKQGMNRLYDFQHADGGWGWWKEGESDHFMTAYVFWGFTLAQKGGVEVRSDVLQKAARFLEQELVEQEKNYDLQSWLLHALAHYRMTTKSSPTKFESKALLNLWNNRDNLNAYTRALLALSAHYFGDAEKARILVQNLENGAKRDQTPDTSVVQKGEQKSHEAVIPTAHWGEDGIFWRWSDGGIEATAFALRALLSIDPQNSLIEPATNWLIKNRRGAQWSNTRDTAITILALNDYLKISGELEADVEYQLLVNGKSVVTRKISSADVFSAPSSYAIDPKDIRNGDNQVQIIRKNGKGSLYFSANATFFSLEEPIKSAGNEIFLRREYFKHVGRPTLLKGVVYDKVRLSDGESVKSGERVEVVLTIETKNNYEYLVFEDLKPAGFEAVEIRSGSNLYAHELKANTVKKFIHSNQPVDQFNSASDMTGRTRWVYQELRDRKVALFIDKLPEGIWQLRYDLRAEVPGEFHALPVLGHAMYVPEIRCNGEEVRVKVVE